MEKRTVIAVILSVIIIILWQFIYVQPKLEKQKELMRKQQIELMKKKAEEQKIKFAEETEKKKEEKTEIVKKKIEEHFPPATTENRKMIVTVKNRYYTAKISNTGGIIYSWTLNEYKDDSRKPLELINTKMRNFGYMPLNLYCENDTATADKINKSIFVIRHHSGEEVVLSEKGEKTYTLDMEYSDGLKAAIKKTLVFREDSYLVGLKVSAKGTPEEEGYIYLGPALENRTGPAPSTIGITSGYQIVIGTPPNNADRIGKLDKTSFYPSGNIIYAGVETLYFASLFASTKDHTISEPLLLKFLNKRFNKDQAKEALAVGIKIGDEVDIGLFLGPKEYSLSNSLGYHNLVDFGFWSFLALPLFFMLRWLNGFIGNYGIAIIIMTIIINLVFYPLRQKSLKSMQKMKELQPRINAIKSKYEKHKKDIQKRQEMNQEIMALYKSEGVSPTGGCLPLLIQFPFLIAIYRMLAVAIELRHAPFFLWITDLSVKDPYYITPIVMGITMWYQNKMTPQTAAADQTTAKMMKFLPIIFTLMFLNFPSGLVLYWLFNNLFAIGQQYLLKSQKQKKRF